MYKAVIHTTIPDVCTDSTFESVEVEHKDSADFLGQLGEALVKSFGIKDTTARSEVVEV